MSLTRFGAVAALAGNALCPRPLTEKACRRHRVGVGGSTLARPVAPLVLPNLHFMLCFTGLFTRVRTLGHITGEAKQKDQK